MQSFHFDTVDSTNELAKRMIREGRVRERTCLIAREQTAGRGSRGRAWTSPKDAGIYLTIVDLPAGASARNTTVFTLATGVACAEILREATGLDVQLKPINDLFLGDAKLGGILTEAIVQGATLTALLTGIGVNTRAVERDVAEGAVPTSLQEHMPLDAFARLDLPNLIETLVHRVLERHTLVWDGAIQEIRDRWDELRTPGSDRCETL